MSKQDMVRKHLRELNMLAGYLCEQEDYEKVANRLLELNELFGLKAKKDNKVNEGE